MTDEKYKKMPVLAKAIYWFMVCVLISVFIYFFLIRPNLNRFG